MSSCVTVLLLLQGLAMASTTFSFQTMELLHMAQTQLSQAKSWVDNNSVRLMHGLNLDQNQTNNVNGAIRDCGKLYEESESRLSHLMMVHDYTKQDALTWVSAVMTNHRTCLDGLQEIGYLHAHVLGQNLTLMLREVLVSYANNKDNNGKGKESTQITESKSEDMGILASWSRETSDAEFIVAQDGSGTHRTIKEAVEALAAKNSDHSGRSVIYVKSGVYNEKVDIGYKLKNVMFVGDGIDKTIVTGNRNAIDGSTTLGSTTFDVSGDGFWARDMTFENTAGPEKHQAVALKVSSDLSIFYKCSFKAYQDTLFVHSNRQFFRECEIHGTIDFIFGDSSIVFQNCDIFLRKPMQGQSNFITAQGRDDPNKPTGISIQSCNVKPSSDFASSKGSIKSFLGRPWKEYSRTVILKTDLDDGLIDPKGWGEWDGDFALSTLYYGEYMNTGNGASTQNRVNWPGFHVLNNDDEASPFTVRQFLQGEQWIPGTGVPYWSGI